MKQKYNYDTMKMHIVNWVYIIQLITKYTLFNNVSNIGQLRKKYDLEACF